MSERSIAEIIGPTADQRVRSAWRIPALRSRRHTVDDLLAWVHDPDGKRHDWSIISIHPMLAGWCVVFGPNSEEFFDERRAPTLLGALEFTVQAVDERDDQ